MKRILLIDDEPDLHNILRYNLRESGFQMDSAYSAREALGMELSLYNLILLDIMMDDLDGIEFLKILKRDPLYMNIPVVLLTAKTEETDKVLGLEIGADDYVTKPFSPRELVARIKAVLRRYENSASGTQKARKKSSMVLDEETKSINIDGQGISLTKKEYLFLKMLMNSPERVFSREEILQNLWEEYDNKEPRIVDALVKRVRKKLDRYRFHIKTHSGFGYSFRE